VTLGSLPVAMVLVLLYYYHSKKKARETGKKVREKSMGKKYGKIVLEKKSTEKKVREKKSIGKKKYGKKSTRKKKVWEKSTGTSTGKKYGEKDWGKTGHA